MSALDAQNRSQYLSFSLAGSEYAVGILQVKEILQYETVTAVPSVPASIRGVINLRGEVVPVVDLAVKFGLGPTPVTSRTCVLIVEATLEGEQVVMGVLADAVREVLDLGPGDVLPPPTFGTQIRVEFLVGMAGLGKGFVLLLDLDRVISAREKTAAAELAAPEVVPGAPAGSAAAVPGEGRPGEAHPA